MFKSKLKFKVFDKRDHSAPHLTSVEVKKNARASCGKLSNSYGLTTPFHLILDYFDNQPGEPIGPFIDFGTHTALQKHFEKVENKPGGQQKRLSESVKACASGIAFVEELDGEEVVYLVPLKSKIQPAGWNKFLKKSKALFGNRKGIIMTEQEWKERQTTPQNAPENSPVEEESQEQPKKKIEGKINKARLNIVQIEKAIGKAKKEKIADNITRFQGVLNNLKPTASPTQVQTIEELLARLDTAAANNEAGQVPQNLSPENRQKIVDNLGTFQQEVTAILNELRG